MFSAWTVRLNRLGRALFGHCPKPGSPPYSPHDAAGNPSFLLACTTWCVAEPLNSLTSGNASIDKSWPMQYPARLHHLSSMGTCLTTRIHALETHHSFQCGTSPWPFWLGKNVSQLLLWCIANLRAPRIGNSPITLREGIGTTRRLVDCTAYHHRLSTPHKLVPHRQVKYHTASYTYFLQFSVLVAASYPLPLTSGPTKRLCTSSLTRGRPTLERQSNPFLPTLRAVVHFPPYFLNVGPIAAIVLGLTLNCTNNHK